MGADVKVYEGNLGETRRTAKHSRGKSARRFAAARRLLCEHKCRLPLLQAHTGHNTARMSDAHEYPSRKTSAGAVIRIRRLF